MYYEIIFKCKNGKEVKKKMNQPLHNSNTIKYWGDFELSDKSFKLIKTKFNRISGDLEYVIYEEI